MTDTPRTDEQAAISRKFHTTACALGLDWVEGGFARELERENARLREAIKHNMRAIDNWLNTYASELCDAERVKEAFAEIGDGGGTLAYIADLQQSNRNLLRTTEAK